MQAPFLKYPGVKLFVDHAPDDAILDPQIEERPEMPVIAAVEILRDVGIDYPPVTLPHDAVRSAFKASWADRPGRKPYEHGRKSVS